MFKPLFNLGQKLWATELHLRATELGVTVWEAGRHHLLLGWIAFLLAYSLRDTYSFTSSHGRVEGRAICHYHIIAEVVDE